MTLGRNYIHKFLIFLICFVLSSCEIKFLTASLWENFYEEEIATFLVSTDERYIAFLGKRYHYVFADNSGVLRQLINLDHNNLIEIDTKRTRLELSSKNEIRGRVIFKSFDKKLSPNSINLLESLGFQSSEEEEDYELEFMVRGMRYLSTQDMIYYLPIVDDKYQIKIYRNLTFGKAVEDAALTPLAIVADSLVILEHLIILPTQD